MNPDTVKEEMKNGEPIIFGDASSEDVLKFAKIKKARVMVITIPDAPGVRKIISMAKRINPLVHIITRTRYVLEVESLYKLGADEVIPEEYETSIEIFSRVLLKYTIPYNEILALVEKIRSECYATFRNDSAHFQSLLVERKFVSTDFYKILISNNSPAANKKISDLAIRKKFKVSVLAIYRQQATIFNPDGEQIILPDDTLLIYGLREEFKNAMSLFNG
jgi:CPA2 family monovalent cation:H+ antiporter-2